MYAVRACYKAGRSGKAAWRRWWLYWDLKGGLEFNSPNRETNLSVDGIVCTVALWQSKHDKRVGLKEVICGRFQMIVSPCWGILYISWDQWEAVKTFKWSGDVADFEIWTSDWVLAIVGESELGSVSQDC